MKKWMYLIFPGIMLGAFLVVYLSHVEEAEKREQSRLLAAQQKLEKEMQEKKEAEARAAEDAKKRQEEREAEEAKKAEERRRKQEAADKEIQDAIAELHAESDKSAQQAAQLEIELDRLHKEKDLLGREEFDLAKQVEAARTAKRTTELQQQHFTQVLAQRAANSTLAAMPPPPPAPRR